MSQVTIGPGDIVWVGQPSTSKVTWTVQGVHDGDGEHRYATLRSGHYERARVVPVQRLVPFTGQEFVA